MRDTQTVLDIDHILCSEMSSVNELKLNGIDLDDYLFEIGLDEKSHTTTTGRMVGGGGGDAREGDGTRLNETSSSSLSTGIMPSSADLSSSTNSLASASNLPPALSPVSASSSTTSAPGHAAAGVSASSSSSGNSEEAGEYLEDNRKPNYVEEYSSRPSLPPLSTSILPRATFESTIISPPETATSQSSSASFEGLSTSSGQHLHPGTFNAYRRASLPTLLHNSNHHQGIGYQPFASPQGWQTLPSLQHSASYGYPGQHEHAYIEGGQTPLSSCSASSRQGFPTSSSDHVIGVGAGSFIPPRSVSPPDTPNYDYPPHSHHSSSSGFSTQAPSNIRHPALSDSGRYPHLPPHLSHSHPHPFSSSYATRRPSVDQLGIGHHVGAASSTSAFLSMRSWPGSPEQQRHTSTGGAEGIYAPPNHAQNNPSQSTDHWTGGGGNPTSDVLVAVPSLTLSPTSIEDRRPNSHHGVSGSISPVKTFVSTKSEPIISSVPPPIKRRGKLPKTTTDLLKTWLHEHADHPYPSEDEKKSLCGVTGLTLNQVSNWMINARRRILAPAKQNAASNIPPSSLSLRPPAIYPPASLGLGGVPRPILARTASNPHNSLGGPSYAYTTPHHNEHYSSHNINHPPVLPTLSMYASHGQGHGASSTDHSSSSSSYTYAPLNAGGTPVNYHGSLSGDMLSRSLIDSRNAYMALPRRGVNVSIGENDSRGPHNSSDNLGRISNTGASSSVLPIPATLSAQLQQQHQQHQYGLQPQQHTTSQAPHNNGSGSITQRHSNTASPDHPFAYTPEMADGCGSNSHVGGGGGRIQQQQHLPYSRSPSIVQSVGTGDS